MDIVQGDFSFDLRSGAVKSSVPKSGFLDPELAGEGEKVDRVILSDGEQVSWNPPVVKPNLPDLSKIPKLAKYFNREGFQTWPCWFYHPTAQEILIKDAQEAHERFGIVRRKATDRERALYNTAEWVWDTPEGCLWQPKPYPQNTPGKFDPLKGEQGKNYVPRAPDPQIAQHALIRELVAAMQGGQNEFLMQLVTAMQAANGTPARTEAAPLETLPPAGGALSSAAPVDEEKAEWVAKAEEIDLKIDRRWSADKIRHHVMTELERRVAEAEAGTNAGEAA